MSENYDSGLDSHPPSTHTSRVKTEIVWSVSELEMFLVLLLAIAKTITFLFMLCLHVVLSCSHSRIRALKACKVYIKYSKQRFLLLLLPIRVAAALLGTTKHKFFNASHFSCLSDYYENDTRGDKREGRSCVVYIPFYLLLLILILLLLLCIV